MNMARSHEVTQFPAPTRPPRAPAQFSWARAVRPTGRCWRTCGRPRSQRDGS